jgi:hypothetical protein
MDQHQEQNALEKADVAEKNVMLGLGSVFDVLAAERGNDTDENLRDRAFATWQAFSMWLVEFENEHGLYITDEEYAALWWKAQELLWESDSVNLLAERWESSTIVDIPGVGILNWNSPNWEATVAGPGLWKMFHPEMNRLLVAERAL